MHALTHPRSATSLSAFIGISLAVVVPWLMTEPWWLECGMALTLAGAGLAAVVDAETGRLPDRLVLLAALPTAVAIGVELLMHPGVGAIAGPVAGVVAFAGPLLVVHVVSPSAMGFGDVKLAAVLGAALGSIDPRAALPALCAASAVTVVAGVVRRRPAMPFGPGLVIGSLLSIIVIASTVDRAVPWR